MVPSKEELAQLAPDELIQRIIRLSNENFQLREILDEVPSDVYWKDTEGVWQGVNRRGLRSLRRMGFATQHEDVIGKTDADIFGPSVAALYRENDLQVISDGAELSKEETVTLPNQQVLTQLSTKKPLLDSTGDVVGIIGSTVDISHIKQVEEKLILAKEEAEQASEAKSEFLRNMEHDIRTPFNGIQGIAELLHSTETDPERQSAIGDIIRSAKELLEYCNGIADLAKAEAGMLAVTDQKFSLHELLDGLIAIEKPAAEHKGLRVIDARADDLPNVIIGDKYRIYRVLINLTSNAIKFTNQGEISIKVSAVQRTGRDVLLRFIVQDTGIGIPEDKKEYVFERFSRLNNTYAGAPKGVGLGLRIVKQFMSEMEGEVDLVTAPNGGTQFICTVPFKLPLTEDFV